MGGNIERCVTDLNDLVHVPAHEKTGANARTDQREDVEAGDRSPIALRMPRWGS